LRGNDVGPILRRVHTSAYDAEGNLIKFVGTHVSVGIGGSQTCQRAKRGPQVLRSAALAGVAHICRRFLPGGAPQSPTRRDHNMKAADLKTGGPRYRLARLVYNDVPSHALAGFHKLPTVSSSEKEDP
jgi:hypothetical protein